MHRDKTSFKRLCNFKILKTDYIFVVILFLLPFIHVRYGVELTDTAYSLGNYENFHNMNLTWSLATFWANVLGKGMTLLPGGHTWLGMSIYTTMLISMCVVGVYLFLRKYMPNWLIFLGEIISLCWCWCPHTVLYNYLSYVLLTVTVITLIHALEKDSKILLGVAGVFLATNVFVRFPNVLEVSLILAVWFYGYMHKWKGHKIIGNTLICMGGFTLGLLISCGVITSLYGFNAIPMMLYALFTMSGSNPGYSPHDMLMFIWRMYKETLPSVFFLLTITMVLVLVYRLCKEVWSKIFIICAELAIFVLFLYIEYKKGMYDFNFYGYNSIELFAIFFLEIAILISIITMFSSRILVEKLFAIIVLIIVMVTPIGSNNGLYPIFNNLFLVAPMTLWMAWNRLFRGNIKQLLQDKGKINWFPVRLMLMLLVAVIMIQSACFGFHFVFRDAGFPYNDTVEIKGNAILAGMRVNVNRAEQIDDFTKYVAEQGLVGNRCITYGHIPGLSYILEMPYAISHAWPDLGSYSYEEMEADIEELTECPIIFINSNYYPDFFISDAEDDDKTILLREYMIRNNYRAKFTSGEITLYASDS